MNYHTSTWVVACLCEGWHASPLHGASSSLHTTHSHIRVSKRGECVPHTCVSMHDDVVGGWHACTLLSHLESTKVHTSRLHGPNLSLHSSHSHNGVAHTSPTHVWACLVSWRVVGMHAPCSPLGMVEVPHAPQPSPPRPGLEKWRGPPASGALESTRRELSNAPWFIEIRPRGRLQQLLEVWGHVPWCQGHGVRGGSDIRWHTHVDTCRGCIAMLATCLGEGKHTHPCLQAWAKTWAP